MWLATDVKNYTKDFDARHVAIYYFEATNKLYSLGVISSSAS